MPNFVPIYSTDQNLKLHKNLITYKLEQNIILKLLYLLTKTNNL